MTQAIDTSAANAPAPVDCAQVHRAVAADRLPDYAETMAAFHRDHVVWGEKPA